MKRPSQPSSAKWRMRPPAVGAPLPPIVLEARGVRIEIPQDAQTWPLVVELASINTLERGKAKREALLVQAALRFFALRTAPPRGRLKNAG